jgi:hypothetical protein
MTVYEELQLVAGAARLAGRLAGEFGERHPVGCDCDGIHMCQAGVEREMTATRTTCEVLAEMIGSYGVPSLDLADRTPGDALRHLADLCDRLDAAHEATPTAVID